MTTNLKSKSDAMLDIPPYFSFVLTSGGGKILFCYKKLQRLQDLKKTQLEEHGQLWGWGSPLECG